MTEDLALEAFTLLLVFKNLFSFALTYGAYDWLVHGGIARTFYVVGSIQLAICLLSIPMCKSILASFIPLLYPSPSLKDLYRVKAQASCGHGMAIWLMMMYFRCIWKTQSPPYEPI